MLWAPMKLEEPLSEKSSDGRPLRDTNRRKAARNASDVKSDTSSMWW